MITVADYIESMATPARKVLLRHGSELGRIAAQVLPARGVPGALVAGVASYGAPNPAGALNRRLGGRWLRPFEIDALAPDPSDGWHAAAVALRALYPHAAASGLVLVVLYESGEMLLPVPVERAKLESRMALWTN